MSDIIVRNQQIYMVDSAKKYVYKYIIFLSGFISQSVLNKDPTVWLDGASPPPRNISKYIKIIIAESCINDMQFVDKMIDNAREPTVNRALDGSIYPG
jgi:hypothetical protein